MTLHIFMILYIFVLGTDKHPPIGYKNMLLTLTILPSSPSIESLDRFIDMFEESST